MGDHCCEYMTGGTTVVLGPTGRNFAAGMSGGVAFVWDPSRKFPSLCNKEGVDIEEVLGEDDEKLRRLVEEHLTLTQSAVAENLLRDWKTAVANFVKVCAHAWSCVALVMTTKLGSLLLHYTTTSLTLI